MKIKLLLKTFTVFLFLLCLATAAAAQKPGSPTPRQEKLLNGLKVLIWNAPAADKVTVKVRIHAGSAFDPQGKEGVMKLLAESLFPNTDSRSFFAEELGGSLEIVSNYDYVQINATARNDQFLPMLETLAAAIANQTIDKEVTAAVKTSVLAKLAELEKDPAYVADRAVAKRLFGTFPYGRPQIGTPESLAKIDFADLIFARERLFSADNATVAISGSANGDLAYRAARRYFGAWLKSDKKIPSTFQQPEDPDTKEFPVIFAGTVEPQVRFALRGVARNDKDYAASVILTKILRARLEKTAQSASVDNRAHILPGIVVIGYKTSSAPSPPASLFADRISASEFAAARTEALAEIAGRPIVDQWLDADTFKTSVADEAAAFANAAIADVQRVADRMAKNPVVTVTLSPGQKPDR